MSSNFFFLISSLRAGLPEGSEDRIQIVMQMALLQRLPLIPIEPDAFATLAMIDRKVEPASDQELHHPESALRTIDRLTRLSQMQALFLVQAFRQVGTVLFEPLPVLSSADPIPATVRTAKGS